MFFCISLLKEQKFDFSRKKIIENQLKLKCFKVLLFESGLLLSS